MSKTVVLVNYSIIFSDTDQHLSTDCYALGFQLWAMNTTQTQSDLGFVSET